MALNSQYSVLARNIAVAALAALCDGGKLRIYDGVQPANGDTAITTQNLLAEFALPTPAFGSPGGGVATANAITAVAVLRAGTATWGRIVKADGTTVVMDGSVGVAAANIVLNSVTLTLPAQLALSALTLTEPAAGV